MDLHSLFVSLSHLAKHFHFSLSARIISLFRQLFFYFIFTGSFLLSICHLWFLFFSFTSFSLGIFVSRSALLHVVFFVFVFFSFGTCLDTFSLFFHNHLKISSFFASNFQFFPSLPIPPSSILHKFACRVLFHFLTLQHIHKIFI